MPRTNNRRTPPPLKRTTPRPIRGGAWRVVCVYWCVLLRSCRQRWTGRNTCRPAAAARLLPQEQQAGVQGRQARTFPPCCCCCNKHNERLRNAHFIRCPPLVRCSSLARPPSPTPHTHICILCAYIYSTTAHTPHWPPPPAATSTTCREEEVDPLYLRSIIE